MTKQFKPTGDPANRMYTIVRELLWRSRQIYKFPVDKDELLLSILPLELHQYVVSHGGIAQNDSYEWRNLTACVNLASSCVVELSGVTGRAFWIQFGATELRPSPVNHVNTFELASGNPHYKAVKKWWTEAHAMHTNLAEYERLLHNMLMRAEHPLIVKDYWPDLYKFVRFKLPTGQGAPEKKRRQKVPMPTKAEQASIIETLAGSTLLPEYKPDVWVDYDVEG